MFHASNKNVFTFVSFCIAVRASGTLLVCPTTGLTLSDSSIEACRTIGRGTTVWVPLTLTRLTGPSEPIASIAASPFCTISLAAACIVLLSATPTIEDATIEEAQFASLIRLTVGRARRTCQHRIAVCRLATVGEHITRGVTGAIGVAMALPNETLILSPVAKLPGWTVFLFGALNAFVKIAVTAGAFTIFLAFSAAALIAKGTNLCAALYPIRTAI